MTDVEILALRRRLNKLEQAMTAIIEALGHVPKITEVTNLQGILEAVHDHPQAIERAAEWRVLDRAHAEATIALEPVSDFGIRVVVRLGRSIDPESDWTLAFSTNELVDVVRQEMVADPQAAARYRQELVAALRTLAERLAELPAGEGSSPSDEQTDWIATLERNRGRW
jgi:hypothetical protein